MPYRPPRHKPFGSLPKSADRPSACKQGYDRRWQRLRLMILAKEPLCRLCGNRFATQVDHVVPRSKGGDDSEDNLQALCASCHSKKTRRE